MKRLDLTVTLSLCCILQLMLLSQASLLPFLDSPSIIPVRPSDLLTMTDPFRVLEQIPLILEREESMAPLRAARVDWKETPESHLIKLDVPGLKKEELKIEVEENRVLLISGERKKEEENKNDRWHCIERAHGKFWRRFRLPENVSLDRVEAKLENGVLIISMPKLSPDRIKGPKVVGIADGEVRSEPKRSSEAKGEL